MLPVLALCGLAVLHVTGGGSYELRTEGQGVYRQLRFLGIGVDVDHLQDDRFAAAIGQMNEELVKACGQRSSTLLEGPGATPTGVTNGLKALASAASPNDRVIVDLVCHGVAAAQGQEFRLVGGQLPMAEVKRLFLRIPAIHKMLIVDGCESASLLEGARSWNPPPSWKDAVGQPCALIVSSVPAIGNPGSLVGGTEFHDRLVKAIDQTAVFGQTGVVSDLLFWLKPKYGQFAGGGGDIVLSGDTTRNPVMAQATKAAQADDSANVAGARALIARNLAQLQRVSLEDARKYADMVKAATFLTDAEEVARNTEIHEWASRAGAVYTRLDYPLEFAGLNRDLANAEDTVAESRIDNVLLKTACARYRSVLDIYSKASHATEWAITQYYLGDALRELGDRTNDPNALSGAMTAYRAGLEIFTKAAHPLAWALIQDDLAHALQDLYDRNNDPLELQDAVAACRAALEIYTKAGMPARWASEENSLGLILESLGERGTDQQALRDSAAAFNAALEIDTRTAYPSEWAAAQTNMGNVLESWGSLYNDSKALEYAVAAFQTVLGAYTKTDRPADWARLQNNLGNALRALGERNQDQKTLQDGLTALRAALEIYTKTALPAGWAMTQTNLGMVFRALGVQNNDPKTLEDGVAAFRAALEVYTVSEWTFRYAETQVNLAECLVALHRNSEAGQSYEAAAQAFEKVNRADIAAFVRHEAQGIHG